MRRELLCETKRRRGVAVFVRVSRLPAPPLLPPL